MTDGNAGAIADRTLDDYRANAEAFREATRDHDVSQNIEALLQNIHGEPPFRILDLGCGPGRDLKTFTSHGHIAVGLDGAEPFVHMARAETGCEVLHQNFLQLDLPADAFDGIFANAVLFHIPSREIGTVMLKLYAALRSGGVLFSSNPRGSNQEGWSGARYGTWYDWPTWRALLQSVGFIEVDHYYRPAGLPREQQPWLASVWRKG